MDFLRHIRCGKLRTSEAINNHTEVIRHYIRGMACEDMVSLIKTARQYTEDSTGYVIQRWIRSCNASEFFRQRENGMNGGT